MTYKTAVFIVDGLQSSPTPYPIAHLDFAGINLGELGVRYKTIAMMK